nr:DUF5067 domain-containing protein [Flavonifractor sp. An135]
MKKKFAIFLLSCAMGLSMVSCSSGDSTADQSSNPAPGASDPVVESTAPTPAPTPESTDAGDLGDYHVEIKDATLSSDYEGNPAIIVTLSWTNNSEETTSAMLAVNTTAFQDGVELEMAIMMDENYDGESSMKDVRPGTTLDVQYAYVLSNTTSPIEIEVSELFSFDSDAPKLLKTFDPASLPSA